LGSTAIPICAHLDHLARACESLRRPDDDYAMKEVLDVLNDRWWQI
jgi:hypothetical protein